MRRPLRAAALCLVLAVAACSHGTDDHRAVELSASQAASPSTARSMQPVWRLTGWQAASPVTVVGDAAVAWAIRAHHLYMLGLDPASGHVRWSHPASRSDVVNGIQFEANVVHGYVVFFGPAAADRRSARMLMASPTTGRIVAQSAPLQWTSDPEPGPTGLTDHPCAQVYDPTGGSSGLTCLVPLRGGGPATSVIDRNDDIMIGDGIVAPDDTHLQRRSEGRVLWTRPTEQLFDPGDSIEWGWDFSLFAKPDIEVGTLNQPWKGNSGARTFTVDYSTNSTTSAIDRRTGTVRWKQRGTSLNCGPGVAVHDPVATPIRCRYRGSVTWTLSSDPDGEPTLTPRGLDVSIERFDPATGRSVWSVPIGAATSVLTGEESGLQDDTHALVSTPSGPIVVDLSTGHTRSPHPDETFWCADLHTYSDPLGFAGQPLAAYLTRVCDAHAAASTVVPAGVADEYSAAYRGSHIVATATGFVAYR